MARGFMARVAQNAPACYPQGMLSKLVLSGTHFCCLASAIFVLSGCWGSTPPPAEPKPKEIPTSSTKPSELTEEELIFRAKRYYEVGLYNEAKENFEAIKSTFPLGPYGEFAEIKAADALYDSGSFAEAAQVYEELSRSRPVSEALPYLLFRTARSYQLAQRGIGRDMTTLDKAQTKYEELLRRFPESRHAWAARELLAEVIKAKADYAESVRAFYARQGKQQAAQTRELRIEQNLTPALAAVQALVQQRGKEEDRASALAELRVQAETDFKLQRKAKVVAPNLTASEPPAGTFTYRIAKAECRAQAGRLQASIFLSKDISDRELLQNIRGKLKFKIPDSFADRGVAVTKCANSDAQLLISETGEVTVSGLAADTTVLTTTLPNPPRLLIITSEL